jgi:hypothetical protein
MSGSRKVPEMILNNAPPLSTPLRGEDEEIAVLGVQLLSE